MMATPTDVWFEVFPGPCISDVLAYVVSTWDWLQRTFPATVSFDSDEPELTDNLCEALEDRDRRRVNGIDCDFQAENWEFRRGPDGRVTRIARTDVRVILGAPGTPHLVLEFKKLDGSTDGRWRYCFDGMNRFVEGKYAVGHPHGVMCGFSPNDLTGEAAALAAYIAQEEYARRLRCISDGAGRVVAAPSQANPACAEFDTNHDRSGVGGAPHPFASHPAALPSAKVAEAQDETAQEDRDVRDRRSGRLKRSPLITCDVCCSPMFVSCADLLGFQLSACCRDSALN